MARDIECPQNKEKLQNIKCSNPRLYGVICLAECCNFYSLRLYHSGRIVEYYWRNVSPIVEWNCLDAL
jgi:hypothetical protein